MSYRCLDCGHTSRGKFPHGKCPACSSYRIKGQFERMVYEREKPRKTLVQSVLMLLLWAALLYGVWDRYAKHWFLEEPQSTALELQSINEKTVNSMALYSRQ